MSRTVEFTKNYIVVLVSEAVVFLMGLWCRAIFVQKLGTYFLGINGLLNSIFSILSLSNLGLGNALAYSMIQAYAAKNNARIGGIYQFSKKVYGYIIIVLVLLSVAMAFVIPSFTDEVDDYSRFYIYYALFTLSKIVTYFVGPYSLIINADQKMRIMKTGELIGYFVSTVLQMISLYIYPSYTVYLFLLLLASIISDIYVAWKFNKNYAWVRHEKHSLADEDKKRTIRRVKDLLVTNVSSAAMDSTDNLLISDYVGLSQVGSYNNYTAITANVKFLAKNIYSAMSSGVTNLIAVSKREEIYQWYHRFLLGFQIVATVFSVCIYLLMQEFITAWLGADSLLPESVLLVITATMYLNILMYAFTCFTRTTDLFTETKNVAFVGTIINVVLSVMLGIRWGLIGILVATTISYLVCNFPLDLYLLCKRILKVNFWKELFLCVLYIAQAIMVAAIGGFCWNKWSTDGFLEWFVKAAAVFVTIALLSILCNIWNKDLIFYWKKTKELIALAKKRKGAR